MSSVFTAHSYAHAHVRRTLPYAVNRDMLYRISQKYSGIPNSSPAELGEGEREGKVADKDGGAGGERAGGRKWGGAGTEVAEQECTQQARGGNSGAGNQVEGGRRK